MLTWTRLTKEANLNTSMDEESGISFNELVTNDENQPHSPFGADAAPRGKRTPPPPSRLGRPALTAADNFEASFASAFEDDDDEEALSPIRRLKKQVTGASTTMPHLNAKLLNVVSDEDLEYSVVSAGGVGGPLLAEPRKGTDKSLPYALTIKTSTREVLTRSWPASLIYGRTMVEQSWVLGWRTQDVIIRVKASPYDGHREIYYNDRLLCKLNHGSKEALQTRSSWWTFSCTIKSEQESADGLKLELKMLTAAAVFELTANGFVAENLRRGSLDAVGAQAPPPDVARRRSDLAKYGGSQQVLVSKDLTLPEAPPMRMNVL